MSDNTEGRCGTLSSKFDKQRADKLLKEAYEQNYVSIYRYCLSRLKNNEMTEDCVQETFLVLYNKFLAGEEIAYIKAFLMKTASNFILKKFDEIKRAQSTVTLDEVINIPSQSEDVDERLTFEEYSRQISAALSSLDAEIFTLKYIEEYKIKEIAARLDMSIPAVTTRLSRMRQKLKTVFKDKL